MNLLERHSEILPTLTDEQAEVAKAMADRVRRLTELLNQGANAIEKACHDLEDSPRSLRITLQRLAKEMRESLLHTNGEAEQYLLLKGLRKDASETNAIRTIQEYFGTDATAALSMIRRFPCRTPPCRFDPWKTKQALDRVGFHCETSPCRAVS